MSTKAELIARLANETGFTKANTGELLESLGQVVAQKLSSGEDVVLPGIGKLGIKKTVARRSRNPRTGEPVNVPAKTKPHFTASKALKEAVA